MFYILKFVSFYLLHDPTSLLALKFCIV